MKRDLELVRKMLLAIEDAESGWAPELLIEGYTPSQIGYHAHLLIDAGLAEGRDATLMGSDSPIADITRLTWAGHEFIEAARDDTLWKRALGTVQEKGGAVTFDILKHVLLGLMREKFGLT